MVNINDLNLTIKEPPLKKFKKQWENMVINVPDIEPVVFTEMSPNSLKVQLKEDANLISGSLIESPLNLTDSPKESILEKWRKSFKSSYSSLSPSDVKRKISTIERDRESEFDEIKLLSDGFFSENENEFNKENTKKTEENKEKSTVKNVKDVEDIVKDTAKAIDEFDFDFEAFSEIDHDSFFESSSTFQSNELYHRVKVKKISESFYLKEGQNFRFPEKVVECLMIKNDITNIDHSPIKSFIRDEWLHCKILDDSIINIIGPISNGEIVIDNEKNYLIIEPDFLINTTVLADSFSCLRRATLSYRTQPSVEDNKPSVSLICGSIVHELVEEAFRTEDYKEIGLNDLKMNSLISENIESIFCCVKDEKLVKDKIVETMQNFPKWCQLYLRKFPAIHGYIQDQIKNAGNEKNNNSTAKGKSTICISKILDLEENIWSVMFGLKGKVDATVVMKFRSKENSNSYEKVVAPFELKTGQSTTSVAHRAQTLLYTLMLHDRYKRPIDFGLLFYISTGDLIRISSWRDEIRSILIARNRLAEELAQPQKLPQQIRNEHLCKKCFQVNSCVMHHKLLENGTIETSSVPKMFEQITFHLNKEKDFEYSEFFRKWQNLITLEEEETIKTRSELWRFDSEKRSRQGRCLNEMSIISCEPISSCNENNSGMNKFSSKFEKNKNNNLNDEEMKFSLLNSFISEGDPIIISCEEPLQYAIATGIVSNLTSETITIHTDRPVKVAPGPEDSLDSTDDQELDLESNSNILINTRRNNNRSIQDYQFRIDKNELTGSFGLLRSNLYKMFSVESEKLLGLVVDLKPPKYLARSVDFDYNILKENHNNHNHNHNHNHNQSLDNKLHLQLKKYELLEDYLKMDEFQKEAFFRSTETLDYLLILGMPGTGKTTTLAFIIRYLVLVMGKTILISSHTHSAIDHIALKLQEKESSNFPFPILRIGNEEKIDKNIKRGSLLTNKKFNSVAEVEHCYSNARVVICTSLGMNYPIFMRKRFDFCLIDEASQLTLPACVGSLRVAQSFILAGDHFQLPPLVRSREALKRGLGESLFKILAEAHPDSMVKLCNQYRMNDEIMLMANRLTYQNLLRCGSEKVREQILDISNVIECGYFGYCGCEFDNESETCWLKKLLSPQCKVAFLNTDQIEQAHEVINGNSFHNEGEAKIINTILKFSKKCGIKNNQISLISPYRPQLKYLNFDSKEFEGVEVSTIDKYQGRDRDCVIISLVRSNFDRNIGELLNDWKRLNVAFTRAKKKLILVGSVKTVLDNSSFLKLKELVQERNWLINLPPNAAIQPK